MPLKGFEDEKVNLITLRFEYLLFFLQKGDGKTVLGHRDPCSAY